MIRSVLIANRGEIARRIIRTARRLGVRTIAVYSDADARAAHVEEADAAVRVGPPPARQSYLDADAILAAAAAANAAAIHPGYGFLSENAAFADAVQAAGLVWIGPPPAAIRAMGLKDAAKRLMREAGVPVTPGYLGDDQDAARLATEAEAIGWPVLIKAVAGGGGKGMRKVGAAADFAEALAAARREAAAAFGDDRVLLEKYVDRPRHIEVQVFADTHGNAVHLFERDCSLQRRHQKVIEEAPAPGMDAATREALCNAAVRAAKAVGYVGAGTVEFIADASSGLQADRIWFMEMNTRLQVEHPVTEAITGVDLVEWQFRVASGEALPLAQSAIRLQGHAVEARLYAEDPANEFLPSTGRLECFSTPQTLRVDSGVRRGDVVGTYYDPMLAKLVSHGEDRASAVAALSLGCEQTKVWPVRTNAWFLARCLAHPDFIAADIDTGFIAARADELTQAPEFTRAALAAAVETLASANGDGAEPWAANLAFFRLNANAAAAVQLHCGDSDITAQVVRGPGALRVKYDGEVASKEIWETADGGPTGATAIVVADGQAAVFEAGAAFEFRLLRRTGARGSALASGEIRSPMPGRIVSVTKRADDAVNEGETLVTLEAMKMEHALKAPFTGHVAEVMVGEGDQVSEDMVLVRLVRATIAAPRA